MRIVHYTTIVFILLTATAKANQEACIFKYYSPGTVKIKYDYQTLKGSSGSTFGSGFFVSGNGHIITANHVIEPDEDNPLIDGDRVVSDKVTVTVGSLQGKVEDGLIVKRDKDDDIALLKIPAGPAAWTSLPIGESGGMKVGDRLTGLGFPQGDITVVPEAPITSQNANVHGLQMAWFQTALALNKGDSGGPIFDASGRVVGIAVATRNDGAQLVSFVIPIQYALPLIEQAGAKLTDSGSCVDGPNGTVEERDSIQHLMDSVCSRGVLQNPASWEMRGAVFRSVQGLQGELEQTLKELPTDSKARQPLQSMQSASRRLLVNPTIFPLGPNSGPGPISNDMRLALKQLRAVFSQNTSLLVSSYGLKGNCTI
jgi:S1-C subfamily serine protease